MISPLVDEQPKLTTERGSSINNRNDKSDHVRIAVLYRVIQHWRVPVFERLSAIDGFDVKVFHGTDFSGSKVVNAKGTFAFEHEQLASIPIKFRTSNGVAMAPFSLSLLYALYKFKPDVLLCEGASNLPNNLLAYIYAFFFRPKIIQWGLGEIKNRKKSWQRKAFDGLIVSMERRADACLAYSTRGREYYERIGVSPEDIFVAVNVVDTAEKLANLEAHDKAKLYQAAHRDVDFVVLFVGALIAAKKVELLLRAFKTFSAEVQLRSRLLIVGEGPDRNRLEQIASNENIQEVVFTGQVIDQVGELFLSADVFVLPGLGGLAVSDAMLHGLPVIASIGDGCERDLLSFGGGILDEELDENRLAEHLKSLATDPARLQSMREKAIWTITEKFNIDTYMKELVACIHQAAAS